MDGQEIIGKAVELYRSIQVGCQPHVSQELVVHCHCLLELLVKDRTRRKSCCLLAALQSSRTMITSRAHVSFEQALADREWTSSD